MLRFKLGKYMFEIIGQKAMETGIEMAKEPYNLVYVQTFELDGTPVQRTIGTLDDINTPLIFAVYTSESQAGFCRFASIEAGTGAFAKGDDYAQTSVIHFKLGRFILNAQRNGMIPVIPINPYSTKSKRGDVKRERHLQDKSRSTRGVGFGVDAPQEACARFTPRIAEYLQTTSDQLRREYPTVIDVAFVCAHVFKNSDIAVRGNIFKIGLRSHDATREIEIYVLKYTCRRTTRSNLYPFVSSSDGACIPVLIKQRTADADDDDVTEFGTYRNYIPGFGAYICKMFEYTRQLPAELTAQDEEFPKLNEMYTFIGKLYERLYPADILNAALDAKQVIFPVRTRGLSAPEPLASSSRTRRKHSQSQRQSQSQSQRIQRIQRIQSSQRSQRIHALPMHINLGKYQFIIVGRTTVIGQADESQVVGKDKKNEPYEIIYIKTYELDSGTPVPVRRVSTTDPAINDSPLVFGVYRSQSQMGFCRLASYTPSTTLDKGPDYSQSSLIHFKLGQFIISKMRDPSIQEYKFPDNPYTEFNPDAYSILREPNLKDKARMAKIANFGYESPPQKCGHMVTGIQDYLQAASSDIKKKFPRMIGADFVCNHSYVTRFADVNGRVYKIILESAETPIQCIEIFLYSYTLHLTDSGTTEKGTIPVLMKRHTPSDPEDVTAMGTYANYIPGYGAYICKLFDYTRQLPPGMQNVTVVSEHYAFIGRLYHNLYPSEHLQTFLQKRSMSMKGASKKSRRRHGRRAA